MTMFGSQWLANAGADAYEIEQSIRFNDNDSAYMHRTPSAAGNQKTNTISCWVKRTNLGLGNSLAMFSAAGGSYGLTWYIDSSQTDFSRERLSLSDGSSTLWQANDYKLRDPGSWYHFVFAMDTTQGTQSNRMKVYINGELITADTNALVENTDYPFFDDVVNRIGSWSPSGGAAGRYMEGYMAEIHLIDGAQKAASDFGKYNSDTGQWVPKGYTGAYGDQGAYLQGQDSSALGDDTSGNGNDFTSSGLAANDQMSDSPTNNWCTLNSISLTSTATLSDGNLTLSNTSTGATTCTLATPSSGKWYFEVKFDSKSAAITSQSVGVVKAEEAYITGTTGGGIYFFTDGTRRVEGTDTLSWGSAWNTGDTIGVAIDLDDDKIWFAINNSWQASGDPSAGTNPATSGFSSEPYAALIRNGNSSRTTGWTANFGQNAFAYTPPTDFLALNSANLPDPAIEDPSAYFQTTLYEGDGSTQSIDQSENSTFSPNFVWIKNRDATDAHALFDTVRGATKVLSSNSAANEATNADTLTAFESDGFALGADVIVNTNAESYVAWQWDAPTTSTNEDGSVDSTLSVSQTSGFSIGTFVGTGSVLTMGHGLGVAPDFVIVRVINGDDDDNWNVYHSALGNTKALRLNLSNASSTGDTYWNNTSPTSTVTTIGTNSSHNVNTKTSLAYSFAAVEGFSAFGSYEGNTNVNGPMANLGFRPAWVMIKNADATGSWLLFDTARDTYNAVHKLLFGQLANVEDTSTAYLDIVSNGFKIRSTGNGTNNAVTYIYAAFAENPFKRANAR